MDKLKVVFYIPLLDQTTIGFFDELYTIKNVNMTVLVSVYLEDKIINELNSSRTIIQRPYKKRIIPKSADFDENVKNNDVIVSFLTKKDWNNKFLKKMLESKLFFFASERLIRKEKLKHLEIIKMYLSSYFYHKSIQKFKPLLLTMGRYTYSDYLKFGCYKNRSLNFAYYPPLYNIPSDDQIVEKYSNIRNRSINILFVGNFYDCKNIHLSFPIIKMLEEKYNIVFTIIGDGPIKDELVEKCNQTKCKSKIVWLGIQKMDVVYSAIASTDICLFTGGAYEGFNSSLGLAVMNGTCVMINKEASAIHTLDGLDYISFDADNLTDLLQSFVFFIRNNISRLIINNRNLYNKMWSPRAAAERFYEMCNCVVNKGYNKQYLLNMFNEGVFSKTHNTLKRDSRMSFIFETIKNSHFVVRNKERFHFYEYKRKKKCGFTKSKYNYDDVFGKLLSSDNPFFVGRLGISEMKGIIECWLVDNKLKRRENKQIIEYMKYGPGIFPNDVEYIRFFSKVYLSGLKNMDYLFYLGDIVPFEDYTVKKYCKELKGILPFENIYPGRSNWSKYLANKKVLIVSPFVDSIVSQYKNKDLLFPGHPNILVDFKLIPYKPVVSHGLEMPNYDTWDEALLKMISDIEKIDFDCALLSCGAYGLPLGSAIKKMGKQAIQICGPLPLYFGIRGKVWDSKHVVDHLINQYWIYPSEAERPSGSELVENNCYWS